MKLGFIGFGEVGFEIARGLKKEGISGVIAYDPLAVDAVYGSLLRERAAEAAVELVATPVEVTRQADVILGATQGSEALQAALDSIPGIGAGKIYADVSTSSAPTKKKIAAAVEARQAFFVDGALMSSISLQQHKTPTLVSGSGSDRFIGLLAPYNMSLEKVSDVAGDAIAIKLVRSIYMKGIASLAVEMLEAAAKLQVDTPVLKSIGETLDATSFNELLNWLVPAGAIHAQRQAHEMSDVTAMLQEIGVEPTMTIATTKRLHWLIEKNAKDRFKGKKPATWDIIVRSWEESP
ncbi:MAG: NAD(P)-binding domain-containing protein [Negativicutes bacterium]|nr:NAD(P)-binding domain-containing protein [Negativicutes bacterium]